MQLWGSLPFGHGGPERESYSEETILRLPPFCHTESCRERINLSYANPLFRGEPCSQCPKHRPWNKTWRPWELPQAKCAPVGRVHPMSFLQPTQFLGHKGRGHAKYSCMQLYTAQCLELQTAATPSLCWSPPAVLHCWGNFGLASMHPKLTSVPKRWSNPAQSKGNLVPHHPSETHAQLKL